MNNISSAGQVMRLIGTLVHMPRTISRALRGLPAGGRRMALSETYRTGTLRDVVEMAVPLRQRATLWARPASAARLVGGERLVGAFRRIHARHLVVSISHDDYRTVVGGVQSCIGREQRKFNDTGWSYLHLCPASPLPMLSDEIETARFQFDIRLDGERIGTATGADLLGALRVRRAQTSTTVHLVIHSLLGNSPEVVTEIARGLDARSGDTVFWVHDFSSICPNFPLLRNDAVFCGGPPVGSPACGVCVYGKEREEHVRRVRQLLEALRPRIVAPSEAALVFWSDRADRAPEQEQVLPHARLELTPRRDGPARAGRPLRVAFLGVPAPHKGWPAFVNLVSRVREAKGADRYEFLHLGAPDMQLKGVRSLRTVVSASEPDAMIEMLRREEVDVVVHWSLCYETFSFTAHEAVVAGAWLIARPDSGAIAGLIGELGQGTLVESEADLCEIFLSGRIVEIVAAARDGALRAGRLVHSGITADLLVAEASARPEHGQRRDSGSGAGGRDRIGIGG